MELHVGATIKEERRRKNITQEQMAEKLKLKRTTYASKEQAGNFTNDELYLIAEKLDVSADTLIELPIVQEPTPFYSKAQVKRVQPMQLLVHDMLMAKAMLRIILRTQAELLAAQQNRTVSSVLSELTKAVREESQEAFDAL